METNDLKLQENEAKNDVVIENNEEENALENELLSEEESNKIMDDIKKSQDTSNGKKGRKKEKKKKEKKLYSLVILTLVTIICCGGAGLVGGYFLYNLFKPEVVYTNASENLRQLEKRAEGSTDLLKTFENDPYNIVNLSMIRFGKRRTSLVLGANTAINLSGHQNTRSAVINTPNRTFNQATSTSAEGAFVSIATAFRFYDEHDDIVTGYEYDTTDDWKKPGLEPSKIYTYDGFIETYGKLATGLYVINDDGKYLTRDYTVEEGDWITSAIIYQISKKSVKSCVVEQLEDGSYTFDMELYSKRACYYASAQVKANGRLPKNPIYNEIVTAKFYLDKDFNLVKSVAHETYRVVVGIEAEVNCDTVSRYFASDTDELIVNGVKIEIPELHEDFPLVLDEKGDFVE